jgi:hypothetical protein
MANLHSSTQAKSQPARMSGKTTGKAAWQPPENPRINVMHAQWQ